MEPMGGFEPPTSALRKHCSGQLSYTGKMERVTGIEPVSQPWEGRILPLNDTRLVGFATTSPYLLDCSILASAAQSCSASR